MERITLTESGTAQVAARRAELGIQPGDEVAPDTNLVLDDYLRIGDFFNVWVIGADSGCVSSYVPDWDVVMPIDLVDYITDRIGPNGETMPIFDEVQAQARAAKASAQNPKQAAKAEHKEERAHRRELHELLRDAIQRLPHAQQKHVREVLKQHGALGKDD